MNRRLIMFFNLATNTVGAFAPLSSCPSVAPDRLFGFGFRFLFGLGVVAARGVRQLSYAARPGVCSTGACLKRRSCGSTAQRRRLSTMAQELASVETL